ncbi:hypothetical protein Tco_1083867 [Tanacetum coccineum]
MLLGVNTDTVRVTAVKNNLVLLVILVKNMLSISAARTKVDAAGMKVTTAERLQLLEEFLLFGGNEATKKTQKTLLKQMYENFSAPSTESLDSIFNRLQKIVSQLAILGENISQQDLNLKFLRSLPSE